MSNITKLDRVKDCSILPDEVVEEEIWCLRLKAPNRESKLETREEGAYMQ